jgi:hypothetical protein
MQPTARAALLTHAAARRAVQPQPPQQQSAAGGTAAHSQQRQQWDARLASFQRGLDHVMRCDAGDACGSSLCHATKRLMRSYATHDCTNPPGASTNSATSNANTTECKVCKLWGYILTKNKPATARSASRNAAPPRWHSPTLVAASSPSSPPILPPISCGLAHARASGGGRFGGLGRGAGGAGDGARVGGMRGSTAAMQPPRRRVVVTPELIKALAKRM